MHLPYIIRNWVSSGWIPYSQEDEQALIQASKVLPDGDLLRVDKEAKKFNYSVRWGKNAHEQQNNCVF